MVQPLSRSLCVFCGSSPGNSGRYRETAETLGTVLAGRKIRLVYGGSAAGTMGVLADSVLKAGGQAIGVIPRALMQPERAHRSLTDLQVVSSLHERKARMAELADAFLALPGGFGTLDELAEALTWSQLGIHDKPCAVLNAGGFFDPLLAYFDQAVVAGFLSQAHRQLLLVGNDPAELVARLLPGQSPPAAANRS